MMDRCSRLKASLTVSLFDESAFAPEGAAADADNFESLSCKLFWLPLLCSSSLSLFPRELERSKTLVVEEESSISLSEDFLTQIKL